MGEPFKGGGVLANLSRVLRSPKSASQCTFNMLPRCIAWGMCSGTRQLAKTYFGSSPLFAQLSIAERICSGVNINFGVSSSQPGSLTWRP